MLLAGLYSRGKSHLLRLSVPIELLLQFWHEEYATTSTANENEDDDKKNDEKDDEKNDEKDDEKHDEKDNEKNDESDRDDDILSDMEDQQSSSTQSSFQRDIHDQVARPISAKAIDIATSIVKSSLAQLCK